VMRLTKTANLNTVEKRAVPTARLFFATCWEVVQSVVHQTLDLIILVRVQASQPIFSASCRFRAAAIHFSPAGFSCRKEALDKSGLLHYFSLGLTQSSIGCQA
jgi:hypothetical protein